MPKGGAKEPPTGNIEPFYKDAQRSEARRKRNWYHDNLMKVLQDCKEKQVRDIDTSIALGHELIKALDEPLPPPKVYPLLSLIPSEDDNYMKPIEPEVRQLLYGSEKGVTEAYLKARCKKSLEDKFNFRLCTSWDYGWQQKRTPRGARENHGRCAILRDTFYRKNNLAPDPEHYSQPAGGEVSICSEYSCKFS